MPTSETGKEIINDIDAEGNVIFVQDVGGAVNINVTDPELEQKLSKLGLDLKALKKWTFKQIQDNGKLQAGMEKLLLQHPDQDDIPNLLRAGSQSFYVQLTNEGGRFEQLEINEHILATIGEGEQPSYTRGRGAKTPPLLEQLKKLQQEPHSNAFLLGQEGAGKTTSLLSAWYFYLEKESTSVIPVYIALNQYNREPREVQEKFITTYIAQNYLGVRQLEEKLETNLWEWLKAPAENTKLLLLLDGLNEITDDITPLLIDLKEDWVNKAQGVQLVVSSRFRSKHEFAEDFQDLHLQPLSDHCIASFLREEGKTALTYPTGSKTLDELLRNPLMFTLFVKVKEDQTTAGAKHSKPQVNRTGELLWNFVTHSMAKFRKSNDPETCARFHFLVQYLVPFLAHRMSLEKTLALPEKELEGIVNAAFERFYQPDFLGSFNQRREHIKEYRKHLHALKLGKLSLLQEISRFEEIAKDFQQELFPLNWENGTLRFLHQSFQDFFAAKHLLNEIELAIIGKVIPDCLKKGILPPTLRTMLGEITGEHYNRLELLPAGVKWADYAQRTPLAEVLEICRKVYDPEKIGLTIWNILTIWQEARGSLAGGDFSYLWLENFAFNQVEIVGYESDGSIVPTYWQEARMAANQFFPQGHRRSITRVSVSTDGQYLATAASDRTIKIWALATKTCLFTLGGIHGHTAKINTIAFCPDNERLVSGGSDQKIIEWSVKSGQCLQVFRGHAGSIQSVDYHPSGQRILSADNQGIVKEWFTATGKCKLTIEENEKVKFTQEEAESNAVDISILKNELTHVAIYDKKGRTFFTGGIGQWLAEWSADSGMLLATFPEGNITGLTMSPCCKKMLIFSPTGGLKEWSLVKRKISQIVEKPLYVKEPPSASNTANTFLTRDFTYSPSGKEILTAGDQRSLNNIPVGKKSQDIQEYSVKSGPAIADACYKTQLFTGHSERVNTVAYHPDGKTFFSGGNDSAIKAWSVTTGQVLFTLHPTATPVNDLLLYDNDQSIIIGCGDGTLQAWNLSEKELIPSRMLGTNDPVYSIGLDRSDGIHPWLIAGGETGMIPCWTLDFVKKANFKGHKATVSSLAVHPKTGQVISCDQEGRILCWSPEKEDDYQEVVFYEKAAKKAPISHVCWSKSGEAKFAVASTGGDIKVFQITQEEGAPECIAEIKHSNQAVYSIDLLGDHLLSGDYAANGGYLKEWNINDPDQPVWEHEVPEILWVNYNGDGNKILCSSWQHLFGWDIKDAWLKERRLDKNTLCKYEGHDDRIIKAVYSQSEEVIFSVSADATLRKWDAQKGSEIARIKNTSGLWVSQLDFSEIRWTEPMTDEEWELLQQYGANL